MPRGELVDAVYGRRGRDRENWLSLVHGSGTGAEGFAAAPVYGLTHGLVPAAFSRLF